MNRTEMLRRLKKGEDPLEISIQKWQDIVDGKGKDLGSNNCALCEKFNNSEFNCHGCAVQQKTKRLGCRGSPYEIVTDETKISKSLAQEELEFLKSLRKKEA